MKQEDWKPTFEEFIDMMSVHDVNDKDFNSVIGRGFVSNLKR